MNKPIRQELLLEIGTEEIPSGYMGNILSSLSGKEGSLLSEHFQNANLTYGDVAVYCTPRRIISLIKDIPSYQDIVVDGPPRRIAYDQTGKPTKALQSFLQKNDTSIENIQVFKGEKEDRIRLVKHDVSNKDIIAGLLPKMVLSLGFAKTMWWDKPDIVFARPIRWILALFGADVVEFSIGGVKSSKFTQGHRFLGKRKIKVSDSVSFFKQLSSNHVIYDNRQRRQKIEAFLNQKRWYHNRGLLDEVTNLVEDIFFLTGTFDKKYLDLPEEVLVASMSKHQRTFCVTDRHGVITNGFVAVINGKYRGLKRIRDHYESVLDARLKDALFFYETDLRSPITQMAKGLDEVVFHKQLGSLADKVNRLKELAAFLSRHIDVKDDRKALNRAITLCKADLLSQMVREFPSLQGIIGGYYARESGENEEVAKAIGEHYAPRYADDEIPQTLLGLVCSLADKLDNIICYFKIGKFPKGSWDIYALRRQAIGIISMLLKKKVSIKLAELFNFLYDNSPGDFNKEKLYVIFNDFFRERFVAYVKERFNFRYDLIDAVLSQGCQDLYNSYLKLHGLNSIMTEQCFEDARCIVERTYNIIRPSRANAHDIKRSLLKEPQETSLYEAYIKIKVEFSTLSKDKDYKKATSLYARALSGPVHAFFDTVMVNVDDKALRSNRLALLNAINRLYVDAIADLSKMVV